MAYEVAEGFVWNVLFAEWSDDEEMWKDFDRLKTWFDSFIGAYVN